MKYDMPKVSVIIPVYNVEQYLVRCLDSVIHQTYENFEIICVNDCSPDNSKVILERYASRYSNKIVILNNEQNLGLGKTRERGIAASSGEYLMFIDSDDYVSEDFVITYVNAVQKKKYDVVIGGYVKDINGKLIRHNIKNSKWGLVTYTIACAKMFKKSFILEHHIQFSRIRCGEDIYFSMCLFCESPVYTIIDYEGYYYCFNRKSITGSLNYDNRLECFVADIFDEFLQKYKLHTLPYEQRIVIEYNYIANMVNALVVYGHGCGIRRMRQKYHFFKDDLEQRFPDYRSNPYFGLFKPRGQTLKIRLGVGVVMGLHKIHLDWLLFSIVSIVL